MLALRLTRSARPAVQLRRLLVATASAGTGFLLLCVLGYALGHPGTPAGSLLLRLAWCAVPLAATAYLALAVARTDPASRPRPGLSAIGLGPTRLMAVSAITTALSTLLGSTLALLVFLHLRGDLTGMPFDGAASEFLASHRPLPLPAALTLLAVVPATASATVALALRPKEARPTAANRGFGRFGEYGRAGTPDTFGAYGRFGARWRNQDREPADGAAGRSPDADGVPASAGAPTRAGSRGRAPGAEPTAALPWGITLLAAGLAVEAYALRDTAPATLHLPGGLAGGPAAVLVGWALTAVGLALAGPGLTHLCGRLLQAVRPGALRLLAGRVLMAESGRIGRPLGVVSAVASAAYALPMLHRDGDLGPLTTLGVLLVAGCTLATLLTAAVEARQDRAETTAALLRVGAPATVLRSAAALRAGALLAVFGPLTLIVAELAALPLTP
ncbi:MULTISPECIES: hypothetical protein [unclassified Streptomyces]|uniref:hypothetical protein n=1 Tax=unclassified Streptomyces TaxID=2593676 RepID=UPI001F04F945|nr:MULTISPECIES: hypothetical protein [unclassified Streptomyces]MCH0565357.1 hypothetical protein [Streptomyces sp. MUM 2J]MCH0570898.1 hypothetical protein [Streptomyces sp. MUM 136J]